MREDARLRDRQGQQRGPEPLRGAECRPRLGETQVQGLPKLPGLSTALAPKAKAIPSCSPAGGVAVELGSPALLEPPLLSPQPSLVLLTPPFCP